MIPGMNSRKMRQAMKQMGIQQQEMDVSEVIFKLADKELVIVNPQVSKVNMMGQQTYQVIGEAQERSLDVSPTISEEDITTVAEQAGVSQEQAKEAIEKANGDLAEAILNLQQ